ncbi:MAG: exodeoxyribonuclease VII large subunit [Solirubrobacterales bacterium]
MPDKTTAPAPTPVGEYAADLRRDLQAMPKATITGELADVRPSRVQYYFQLRDEQGGVPCTMWKNEFERLGLPPETLKDGAAIVATGAPDYYPGGRNASPAFSFRITSLRPAGEGDLLARLAALRRKFDAEGLMKPQKLLSRPQLPKRIGVITAEGGAARQDLLVGLERRGWQGEIVWGFAPVQDRKAAPLITRALSDMAALGDVDAIVVCRGGGSLTDLWAFCDENLCRTAAMLAIPVISAVGHERDVTLLDDVAAVRCSTPTHAAEAAVPLDCRRARSDLQVSGRALAKAGSVAVTERVGPLVRLAGGPARAIREQRGSLNQKAREVRASSERGLAGRRTDLISGTGRHLATSATRVSRTVELSKERNAGFPEQLSIRIQRLVARDRNHLDRHAVALRAHDPQRTLERGYARVEDTGAEPVVTSIAAKEAGEVKIHFADGVVNAGVDRPPRQVRRRSKSPDPTDEFQQTSFEGVNEDE